MGNSAQCTHNAHAQGTHDDRAAEFFGIENHTKWFRPLELRKKEKLRKIVTSLCSLCRSLAVLLFRPSNQLSYTTEIDLHVYVTHMTTILIVRDLSLLSAGHPHVVDTK